MPTTGMKVILSVDAIRPTLTGIGRYTWELGKRLPAMPSVECVRLFSQGRWISNLNALREASVAKAALRQSLLRNSAAVATYRWLAPHLLQHRLRPYADHVFHGTNYYLPPFSGPSVATIHDLSIFRFPQFHPPERVAYMQKEIPLTLRRASFLISDSEFIRQEIINYFGWPAEKIRSVPLGVSDEYCPRDAQEVNSVLQQYQLRYGQYSLFVSTIEPRKNIEALLRAYEGLPILVRNTYPLVLIGGYGWQSDAIHRRINDGVRQGWLRYLGFVPELALPALFSGARAFVFPSLYEGFGLPVIEAMASGLPVLISNRSSLPEIAQGAALVVEPEDVSSMTASIRILLEDTSWRASAIQRSISVASQYRWSVTAQLTSEVYRLIT
jgi:glycosyltransferase involved in cell wall biosynthesis